MALEINNVSFKKNKKEILKNINLSLDTGIYSVLGSNGAGKSTLLKVISTLLLPTEGNITFQKQSVKKNREYLAALSYLPQNVGLIKDFDVVDNLHYFGLLKGCKNDDLKTKISAVINDFDLNAVKNIKVFNLSGGLIQRIGIALSLINSPSILLLDEPFNNLDSTERTRLYEILKKVSENATVIISTHLISEIENVADEFIFLKEGKVTFKGSKKESVENYLSNFDENPLEHNIQTGIKTDTGIFERASEYYTKYV